MAYFIVNSARDLVTTISLIIHAAQTRIVWRVPSPVWDLFVVYGIHESAQAFVERNGSMRGIVHITQTSVASIHPLMQAGAAIRHAPQPPHQFILIADDRESVRTVRIEAEYHLSAESRIGALQTDDPTYARRLLTDFEAEWAQATDGTVRLRDLSQGGI